MQSSEHKSDADIDLRWERSFAAAACIAADSGTVAADSGTVAADSGQSVPAAAVRSSEDLSVWYSGCLVLPAGRAVEKQGFRSSRRTSGRQQVLYRILSKT